MKEHLIILIILLMSTTVDAQIAPGEALRHSRQAQDAHHFGEAKRYAQAAISGYSNGSQPDSLGEAYVMLWSSSSLDGLDYAGRIPILQQAGQAFEQAGNRKRLADVLTDEADLYNQTDSAPVALHKALQALQLYQAVRYPKLQAIYNLLTSVYILLGDYNESVRYGLLSIHTAAATGDTSASLSAYYNHLGVAYTYMSEWDHAENYLQKGLVIALKYHDTASIAYLAGNLTNIYWKSGRYEKARRFLTGMLAVYPGYFARDSIGVGVRFVEIYTGLRQFQRGEPYANMLKRFISHENGLYYVRMEAVLRVARYYMDQEKFDTARYYLDDYAAMGKKYKFAPASLAVPFYSFRLDSLSGHYLDAMRNYERYKSASDSILAVAKSRQLAQYRALYETDQKDRSIQSLKQQAEVQSSRLRQEVFLRRMIIGGVALLLLLVSVLYYAYRLTRRSNRLTLQSNRLLEAQRAEIDQKNQRLERLVTEKEWLVTEIHHRVKNNLYLISSLLESQGAFLHDEALFEIQKSQHRVQAISLIHQKLFLNEQVADVEMSIYLREIVSFLRDSLVPDDNLVFNLDLDPVQLDVAKAVPLGLIVNEAVTNAVKYAFPRSGGVPPGGGFSQDAAGRIDIVLKQELGGEYSLRITDNGVGLPGDCATGQKKSLGMSLIEGLSRALQADLRIHSGPGTTIEVVFADVHAVA